MNFVKNRNFLLFRNVFIEIILWKCLKNLILCILAPIGTASYNFFIGDIVDSGTIVEKYAISFASKKENRFGLFNFLAIFTK